MNSSLGRQNNPLSVQNNFPIKNRKLASLAEIPRYGAKIGVWKADETEKEIKGARELDERVQER